jgi:hypothetical protein
VAVTSPSGTIPTQIAASGFPGAPEGSRRTPAMPSLQVKCRGGFGGMLSVCLKGGEAAAIAAAARVESLIEHRASVEGAASPCSPGSPHKESLRHRGDSDRSQRDLHLACAVHGIRAVDTTLTKLPASSAPFPLGISLTDDTAEPAYYSRRR